MERETKEAEDAGRGAPITIPWRTMEGHQARLVWMDGQTESSEALGQDIQHAARVVFSLEDDHEVVSEPYEYGATTQARRNFADKPRIEHFVQVDVRQ